MTLFLQYAAQGLTNGFVIGLLAASLVVVYRSTRVLSFAQGAIGSLGTYAYYQLAMVWGWSALVALPLGLLAGLVSGTAVYLLAMRPLRRADALTRTVSTLGAVLVLQMIIRTVWGGNETFIRRMIGGRLDLGSFTMSAQELLVVLVVAVVALALNAWSTRSYTGLALAAIAQNSDAARLGGVSPERAAMLAWGIGGVLAALAGILVTPLLVLNPLQMTLVMVTAFGGAMLGGFTSLPIAMAGGCLIGVVQSVVTGYLNVAGLSETFGFIVVFVVLLATRGRRTSIVLAPEEAPV
jgi:branched-subunit amino acid ABC-type transport system permease component